MGRIGKLVFGLIVGIAILTSGIALGYGSWYDVVERNKPVYAWMQELAGIKLTWGITFSEYAKPEPISRLQFVRDITSAVDALWSALERVRERGSSLKGMPVDDACALLGLPEMTPSDVERISVLVRSLIKYFSDDISSLSPEEDTKQLLSVVDSFESEVKAFLNELKLDAPQKIEMAEIHNPHRGSVVSKAISAPLVIVDAMTDDGVLSHLGSFGGRDGAIIAYWLGEGRILLRDAIATTVKLPFMSLRVSRQSLRSLSSGSVGSIFSARVAIPLGKNWHLLSGYAQCLPLYRYETNLQDLLNYGAIEVGGQYQRGRLTAHALYMRLGGGNAALLNLKPLVGNGEALHGLKFGFTLRLSGRLLARYNLQLLSSPEKDGGAYRVHTGEIGYLWGSKWALSFGIRRTVAPFGLMGVSTDAAVGVSYSISPDAEVRFLYRINDYRARQTGSQEETARLQLQLRF